MLLLRERDPELNIERFIAERISGEGLNRSAISKPIVKIGIIGIATGVAVMLLTVSIVSGFKKEVSERISGLNAELVIKAPGQGQGSEPGPVWLPDSIVKALQDLPFVERVQKVAFKNGILKTKSENEGILLKGVERGFDFSYLKQSLVRGRLPDWPDGETGSEILVSRYLADRLGLDTGSKVLVYFISQKNLYDSLMNKSYVAFEKRSRNFIISGIFKTDFAEFDKSLAIVHLPQIQKLNYWREAEAGAYELRTSSLENLEQQVEQVQEVCGYGYSVESIRDLYYAIFIWLEKLDINGVIIVVLMVLVATVNMITALLILILERSRMIGLVKTLGLPNARVRRIFLWISFRLTGKGLLYGNLAGIGLCLLQYYFRIAKLDPQTYYVSYVAIELNWWYVLLLNLGTLLVCLLVLILPTLVITRLTPVRTLRWD